MTAKQICSTIILLLFATQLHAATGDISTVIGVPNTGDNIPAVDAALWEPLGISIDASGNLIFGDWRNDRLRKIDTSGTITTLAGNGVGGYSGDGGLATDAQVDGPFGTYVDALGNIYFSDYHNHRVRKIDTSGNITTFAGNGVNTYAGDGGLATNASLQFPLDVRQDASGNFYIIEGQRIRKVDTSNIITTFAGTGTIGYTGDGGPATNATLSSPNGLAFDGSGDLYFADSGNNVIRKISSGTISTEFGTGNFNFGGDGGLAINADFRSPSDVFFDGSNNAFIVDRGNNRVRRVDNSTSIITTVAGIANSGITGDGGPATNARFALPHSVLVDGSGNIIICDLRNNRIRKVDTGGTLTTIAGAGTGDGGPKSESNLNEPYDVALDAAGNIYVLDGPYHRIKKIDTAGNVTRLAGTGYQGFSGDGGPASLAETQWAQGFHVTPSGEVYIADAHNNRIRKVDLSGNIATVAGSGATGYGLGGFSGDGGQATNALLSAPIGIHVDSAGNMYIAEYLNHRIRKVDVSGVITTIAGTGTQGYTGDGGLATNADISYPWDIDIDSAGNILFSVNSNVIRQIDTSGNISTVVGTGTAGFAGDNGPATNAQLNNPQGIHIDPNNNLYIADNSNHRIRKVDFLGTITTLAGNGGTTFSGDGIPATLSSIYHPASVTTDPAGNIYIADRLNHRLRKVTLEINPLVSIPDTTSPYSATVNVPIRIQGAAGTNIVAAELKIAFDNTIVTLGSPNQTDITGTLVALGWSIEENVFPGSGTIDTLAIAMSTAQDTINSDGDLITLIFDTANIRQPAFTALELTQVLLNDGVPSPIEQDGSITLTGTDGTITATPDSINPGDVVSITVTDADLDLDVGNPDQVTATAISKLYNDTQTITLTETGANTGIFAGTLNTLFALTAGPSEDGFIGTIAGDSICVSFSDVLTSIGTTATRYDTVEVIGGEDGVVVASFVVQALDGRNGVRDTVRVQVTDSDLDVDVGVADQVSVTIVNASSGESELVTLTETGVTTGIFQARVPTIFGASGTTNDGELSLASQDDSLGTAYVDALTSQGGGAVLDAVTYVVNLFGDVRSNDNVQAFDAASILAHAVGLNTYTFRDSLLGDVDGNGDVQAFDASQVLQYVVRLIDRFPVQTDDNITPPGDLKNHPFLKPVPLNQIIALGELQPQGDGTHLMPIQLTDRQGVISATLELNHSEHLQILDVTTDAAYDGFMVAHNAEKDRVLIAFAGAQSHASGSGNILYLHIKATGELQFSLDHVVLNGHTLTPTAPLEVLTQAERTTPLVYALHQNHPNPFNPETVIQYDVPEPSTVYLTIYNIMGQKIRTLLSEHQNAGNHRVIWNAKDDFGRDVSTGVYFIKMESNTFEQTQKMLLLK